MTRRRIARAPRCLMAAGLLTGSLLMGAIFAALPAVFGQDGTSREPAALALRIDSFIYDGKENTPAVKNRTYFSDDAAYDVEEGVGVIVVHDFENEQVILLDSVRRIRTTISFEELDNFLVDIVNKANQQSDSFIRFTANPRFDEAFDSQTGRLRLASPWIVYDVENRAADEAIVEAYCRFADRSAILAAYQSPGSPPPKTRLALNSALELHQRFPSEVRLTLRPSLRAPSILRRSEHVLRPALGAQDLETLRDIRKQIGAFREVRYPEF